MANARQRRADTRRPHLQAGLRPSGWTDAGRGGASAERASLAERPASPHPPRRLARGRAQRLPTSRNCFRRISLGRRKSRSVTEGGRILRDSCDPAAALRPRCHHCQAAAIVAMKNESEDLQPPLPSVIADKDCEDDRALAARRLPTLRPRAITLKAWRSSAAHPVLGHLLWLLRQGLLDVCQPARRVSRFSQHLCSLASQGARVCVQGGTQRCLWHCQTTLSAALLSVSAVTQHTRATQSGECTAAAWPSRACAPWASCTGQTRRAAWWRAAASPAPRTATPCRAAGEHTLPFLPLSVAGRSTACGFSGASYGHSLPHTRCAPTPFPAPERCRSEHSMQSRPTREERERRRNEQGPVAHWPLSRKLFFSTAATRPDMFGLRHTLLTSRGLSALSPNFLSRCAMQRAALLTQTSALHPVQRTLWQLHSQ